MSDEVFDSWFQLIARGRAEGPSSVYYVDILGIQSVACSQTMPLGPPCNASAPTGSRQPLGNESMSYGEIFHQYAQPVSDMLLLVLPAAAGCCCCHPGDWPSATKWHSSSQHGESE